MKVVAFSGSARQNGNTAIMVRAAFEELEKEGIETIMDLRRAHKTVPILVMSGGGAAGPDGYLVPAIKLGADRSLAKPFRIDVFLEVVRDLLKG